MSRLEKTEKKPRPSIELRLPNPFGTDRALSCLHSWLIRHGIADWAVDLWIPLTDGRVGRGRNRRTEEDTHWRYKKTGRSNAIDRSGRKYTAYVIVGKGPAMAHIFEEPWPAVCCPARAVCGWLHGADAGGTCRRPLFSVLHFFTSSPRNTLPSSPGPGSHGSGQLGV